MFGCHSHPEYSALCTEAEAPGVDTEAAGTRRGVAPDMVLFQACPCHISSRDTQDVQLGKVYGLVSLAACCNPSIPALLQHPCNVTSMWMWWNDPFHAVSPAGEPLHIPLNQRLHVLMPVRAPGVYRVAVKEGRVVG